MSSVTPRVAIVVPAYNRADLLGEALESVVCQSYRDWEAIVVDDASTDGSYAVACAFAERHPQRISVLRRAHNGGVGAARTLAVSASRGGELVCLLDHDDLLREDYLARMVGAYDDAVGAGLRVGVVSCDASLLTADGITGETWYGRYAVADPLDLDSMIRQNHVFARALFSRAAYERVGGRFSEECRSFDDYDLWLRMLEAGYEAIVVDEPLAIYRDHPTSYSCNRVARAEGAIVMYRRALERRALTLRQRRLARRQILHYRASLEWALLHQALTDGHGLTCATRALRAIPLAMLAFAQQPRRWPAWWRRLSREVRELAASPRATEGQAGYRSSTNP
jgi:glycosyltransferase involved in cell wall biosynthesis